MSKLPRYAWPGGYPLGYLSAYDEPLCPECAERENRHERHAFPNWGDPALYCEGCANRIESAYAEDLP